MQRLGESLAALDDPWIAGEPALGEERRQQPVVRRLPGVKRLRHGAEARLEPGGLGAGEAERVLEALEIEPEQMSARRRGAEGADGSGGMEAGGVVTGVDDRAQAALDLDAGHDRGQQLAAPDAPRASASASAAGITGTEGCPLIVVWVSSKSSAWDAAPLMSAARSAEVRSGSAPSSVDSPRSRPGASWRRRMTASGSRDPASVAPSQSRRQCWAVVTASARQRREGVGAGELRELARCGPLGGGHGA